MKWIGYLVAKRYGKILLGGGNLICVDTHAHIHTHIHRYPSNKLAGQLPPKILLEAVPI